MRLTSLACVMALVLALPVRAEDAPDDDYMTRVQAGRDQYLLKNNIYRATREFREAMRLAPDRHLAFRGLGACLVKRGGADARGAADRERGIFLLVEALKRAKDDPLTHYWLGIAYSNHKKAGLAWHHFSIAKSTLKKSDFPDEKAWKVAVDTIDRLMPEAERAGGAKFDAAAAGPVAKVILEYAANLYGDMSQITGSSVPAGQALVKELLLVQAWDGDGRVLDPAKTPLKWTCSPGLLQKDGLFFAGDKPGKEQVFVSDEGGKVTASVTVTVLGPAVKLAIVPESATIAQNQGQPFEVKGLDAAGNTVLVPALAWKVSAGSGLARPETSQDAENLLDPHRNSYDAPEGAEPGTVKVSVSTPDGALTASATVTVEKRRMDKLQSRAKAVAWENLSLDEALRKAAQVNKPLLVEITASWCPFCRKFEEGPLSDEKVGAALKDWLAVQVDADQHPELVERFGVDDLPMVALLTPRGSMAGGFGNNMEPNGTDPRTTTDAFIKALADARSNVPRVDEDETRRLGEQKDAAKMESLARWYWDKKRWKDAEKWARDAMAADDKRGDAMAPFVVFSQLSYGEYDAALKDLEAFLSAHPQSAAAAQLLYYKGLALVRQKQEDKAAAVFAEVQKKWPTSVWARKAAKAGKK